MGKGLIAMASSSLPLEGRVGVGVALWIADGPPPSIPPLKGEGREKPEALCGGSGRMGEIGPKTPVGGESHDVR